MKKLVAALCAAALLLTMIVPALANPSISDLSESVKEITPKTELSEGKSILVLPADVTRYENAGVQGVVSSVNDGEEVATFADVISALNANVAINPEDYDFITAFSDVILSDGETLSFTDEGNVVAADVKMDVDVLKDVDANDLGDYAVVLIDPANGAVDLLTLDAETFAPETGEITVSFPHLGTFALIQKV